MDMLDIFVPHVLLIDYRNKIISGQRPDPTDPTGVRLMPVMLSQWDTSSLKSALDRAGVTTFAQYQNLRRYHFEQMTYNDPSGTTMKLQVYTAAQAVLVVAFYHHIRSKLVDDDSEILDPAFLTDVPSLLYDFQTLDYDPEEPIVPWRRRLVKGDRDDNRKLENWNKGLRISVKDFPIFKDPIYWNKFRRAFLIAMEACGLLHLLDPNYKITCEPLYKAQSGWVYKMMQDNFQEPYSKTIVIKNVMKKEIYIIWISISEYHDTSMANNLRTATISAYVTSVRLHKLDFRGNLSTWILNYTEQIRLHNDMVTADEDKISDGQAVNFLEAAISGIPSLASVRHAWSAAQKGAGRIGARLTLVEYTELLLAQSAVLDAPKSRSSGRYRANVTEHAFDDDSDDDQDAIEPDSTGTYDVANHEFDIDSPPELMMFLNERHGGPRPGFKKKAWMDKDSWSKLSQSDRDAWDNPSDSAKATIRSACQSANNSGGQRRLTSCTKRHCERT